MTTPLVSICMPAYNAAPYIVDAIQSVIDQTYGNWELIVVDDGSIDGTADILDSMDDYRIHIYHQKNKGQCAAANKAFELSSGELIKFFDADDILSPAALENQVKKLDGSQTDIASAMWGRFYNNDLTTFKLNPESVWRDMPASDWLVESWIAAQPMMQCGLWLIPRSIINKAGLWDERLSLINDFDFFTRVLVNCNNVLFTTDAVLYYRSGLTNSLSGTKTRKGYESAFLSIEKAVAALLQVRDDAPAKQSCANIWQNFIYDVYPLHMDLVKMAEKHLTTLPAPTLSFPCGGYTKLLHNFLSWKFIKTIKHSAYMQIQSHQHRSVI